MFDVKLVLVSGVLTFVALDIEGCPKPVRVVVGNAGALDAEVAPKGFFKEFCGIPLEATSRQCVSRGSNRYKARMIYTGNIRGRALRDRRPAKRPGARSLRRRAKHSVSRTGRTECIFLFACSRKRVGFGWTR